MKGLLLRPIWVVFFFLLTLRQQAHVHAHQQEVEDSSSSHAIPAVAPSLVELTAADPQLSTLVMAKQSANFAQLLSQAGKNYTFFAPNNAAFAELAQHSPELARALFTAPWLQHLQNLLSFHIIDTTQAIHTFAVQESTAVHTLNGEALYLTRPYYEHHDQHDAMYVWPAIHGGYARVTAANQAGQNGVAHTVNAVLLPAWMTQSIGQTLKVRTHALSTFRQLVQLAGLDKVLAKEFGLTVCVHMRIQEQAKFSVKSYRILLF